MMTINIAYAMIIKALHWSNKEWYLIQSTQCVTKKISLPHPLHALYLFFQVANTPFLTRFKTLPSVPTSRCNDWYNHMISSFTNHYLNFQMLGKLFCILAMFGVPTLLSEEIGELHRKFIQLSDRRRPKEKQCTWLNIYIFNRTLKLTFTVVHLSMF